MSNEEGDCVWGFACRVDNGPVLAVLPVLFVLCAADSWEGGEAD
jgi:hypothetical protein